MGFISTPKTGRITELSTDVGNPNDTTTDSLHGKIGTDAEMLDRSLFDLLGGPSSTKTLQGLPQMATKATAALPQTADASLFTVSGGQIELLSIVGEVTTEIETQDNTTKLKFNPASAGADVDLCADLNITADAVGTLYSITGNPNDVLQDGLWVVSALAIPIVLGPGIIELECDASNTGNVGWQVVYRRIESGATLIAN